MGISASRPRRSFSRIDHDKLFKELLRTFFYEFLMLFFPRLAAGIDRKSLQFLDKEIFTDIATKQRHAVDLLAKVRLRGKPVWLLVHIETQARKQKHYPRTVFHYFARLHMKHLLPIYPIVLYSYDKPKTVEPDTYAVDCFDFRPLEFHFKALQLNKMDWRKFVKQPNPVASALMTRMKFAEDDRPRVKLECLRMIATLKLDPARATLIGTFMDTYLKLTAKEQRVYDAEVAKFGPEEKEQAMLLTNEWIRKGERKGRKEGQRRGQLSIVTAILTKRVGKLPANLSARVRKLTSPQLDRLAVALFEVETIDDLKKWLVEL